MVVRTIEKDEIHSWNDNLQGKIVESGTISVAVSGGKRIEATVNTVRRANQKLYAEMSVYVDRERGLKEHNWRSRLLDISIRPNKRTKTTTDHFDFNLITSDGRFYIINGSLAIIMKKLAAIPSLQST